MPFELSKNIVNRPVATTNHVAAACSFSTQDHGIDVQGCVEYHRCFMEVVLYVSQRFPRQSSYIHISSKDLPITLNVAQNRRRDYPEHVPRIETIGSASSDWFRFYREATELNCMTLEGVEMKSGQSTAEGELPCTRWGHSMVMIDKRRAVVFGGMSEESACSDVQVCSQ